MFWILLSSLQKIQLCFYFWNHPLELRQVDQFRIEPWVWKILCFQHCCTSIPLWIFLSLLWRKTSWHNFQNAKAFNKLEISTMLQCYSYKNCQRGGEGTQRWKHCNNCECCTGPSPRVWSCYQNGLIFGKAPRGGGRGHFQSKNLYCRFWIFKGLFSNVFRKNCNKIFRKWGGVKGRLELFRKCIRFDTLILGVFDTALFKKNEYFVWMSILDFEKMNILFE